MYFSCNTSKTDFPRRPSFPCASACGSSTPTSARSVRDHTAARTLSNSIRRLKVHSVCFGVMGTHPGSIACHNIELPGASCSASQLPTCPFTLQEVDKYPSPFSPFYPTAEPKVGRRTPTGSVADPHCIAQSLLTACGQIWYRHPHWVERTVYP